MLKRFNAIFNKHGTAFQVLSDLHLEVNQQYQTYEVPTCAPNLILAGDIGRLCDYEKYRDFLQYQTDRFQQVFLVLGNHEFYSQSFASALESARAMAQEACFDGRLILLHQTRYDMPDSLVTILGCPLWSHIPEDQKGVVTSTIQDFKQIEGWTAEDHNQSHVSDLTWLSHEIDAIQASNRQKPMDERRVVLVVTHHAPSIQRTSHPQYQYSPWRSAFATDVVARMSELTGVKAWVFGHTHYCTDVKERGVRIIANQRGYKFTSDDSKEPKDGFDSRKVIHV
ncbi:Uncharacterized protein PECH_004823 [Penicillium ucsense]|uniref:Calcineurin-like phosphoesterase domain-containing protein n=1 Tax=Penicillium ucsense TaxID=2839758 RepID=A0A8J8W9J1_9EURO|nr:Uncharacterized protein PECM_007541 [Penicillium ucsense]KAF7739338.1 Uncharacterized protein PECH_004823 [Penicillium ucsense]